MRHLLILLPVRHDRGAREHATFPSQKTSSLPIPLHVDDSKSLKCVGRADVLSFLPTAPLPSGLGRVDLSLHPIALSHQKWN